MSAILISGVILLILSWFTYRRSQSFSEKRPQSRGCIPSELDELSDLFSAEGQLVSWHSQPMGWLGIFNFAGRTFQISSHRGDVEIHEVRADGQKVLIGLDGPKSSKEILELI